MSRRAASRRRAARVAALRGQDRAWPARLPRRGRISARSPRTSRISAALRQLPGLAVQRLMADGYGFGGEGDWKTAVLLRALKAMSAGLAGGHVVHGGLHLPPGARAASSSSARTCSRSARRSPPGRRRARSTRSASAAGRTRCGWSSTPRPALPWSSASPTSATGSGSWPTRSTSSPRLSRCPGSRSPGRSGGRARLAHLDRGVADGRRPAPHRAVRRRRHRGAHRLLADMLGVELLIIDADTTIRRFASEMRWNQAYYRLAQGF